MPYCTKEYSTNLKTERQRYSGKIKKKRASQKAVNEYSHILWMQNLASNLAKQKKEQQKEETKLKRNWTGRMGRSMKSAETIKRGKNRQLVLAIYFSLLIFLIIIYCFGLSTDSLYQRPCLKA